jgi:tetratricopeptide (TPR) repeat protein
MPPIAARFGDIMVISGLSTEAPMSRAFVAGLCVFALALAPISALAEPGAAAETSAVDDKEARDLFRIGKEAFEEGRFERALKYFKEAYELSRRPALLSNIGTTLDRLRRDREAVDVYKQYLVEVPGAGNRALIESRIQLIEAALADAAKAQPQAAEAEPTPKPQDTAETTPEASPVAQVPTPQETALAAQATQPDATTTAPLRDSEPESASLTSRWWFWTGVGALAATAVVVGVAASSGGNSASPSPVVLDTQTRVRQL